MTTQQEGEEHGATWRFCLRKWSGKPLKMNLELLAILKHCVLVPSHLAVLQNKIYSGINFQNMLQIETRGLLVDLELSESKMTQ